MPLQGKTTPLIPNAQRGGLNIKPLVSQIKDRATATAFDRVQDWVDQLERAARKSQSIEELMLTSPDGRLVFWAGDRAYDGVRYSGSYSREFYAGGDDPPSSPLYTDRNGRLNVTLGDAEDVGGIVVKDAAGDTVVQIGKFGSRYGITTENIWVGPDADPDTAVFWSDGGTTVIGKNGRVFVRNTRNEDKGFIGVQAEAPKNVTGAANNGAGLIRLTVATHGYETGDTVDVTAVGGVPAAVGSWPITVITANTFDLVGSTFAGAYTSGGTAYRYFGGVWTETAAHGGTGFEDALFRVFADSSLRIGVAGGSRLEVSAVGDVALTDAEILITGSNGGNDYQVNISGSEVTISDTTNNAVTTLLGGAIRIDDNGSGAYAIYGPDAAVFVAGSATLQIVCDSALGPSIAGNDSAGNPQLTLDFESGSIGAKSLYIGAFEVIDSSRNADLTNVDASGVYKVGGVQVLTSQQAAIADAIYTPNATPLTYDVGQANLLFALHTQLSTFLNAARTHGWIAT
jgi:hypothetical protein